MEFDDYESLPTSNVGVHMAAGAAAGVVEHTVMFPLDSVKVFKLIIPVYLKWRHMITLNQNL